LKPIISRRALFGALLAPALGLAAPAFAAKTLHVTRSITINAPAAKVWGIVHDFGDLTWVPVVKSSHATDGNKAGSIRSLNLGGPVLTEQLVHYDAPETMYKYKIQNTPNNRKILPVSHYLSVITVKSLGQGKTKVTWTGRFERVDTSAHPKKGMGNAAALKAVGGIYGSGLANLKTLAMK
jgi:hypothetical protein